MASPSGASSSTGRDRDSTMGSNEATEPKRLTIRELEEITDNFSAERLIGQGGYGKVYKGVLDDGEEVAVKVLHNNVSNTKDEEFQHEFDNLIMLNHPNIVQLVSYCYETQRHHMDFHGKPIFAETTCRALCFEYMHMGSLQGKLYDESHGLEWKERYKIIKGACEGLKYLHGLREPIFHLDLKPDNILLDENMTPKLADFGLSKLCGAEQTRVTQNVTGTCGYMPQEYLFRGLVSNKVDIFSMGVVITKIIAGPRGNTRSAEMPRQEFLEQVRENWRNRLEATCISGKILEAYCEQVSICTEIGLSSMEDDRHERPSIVNIVDRLDATEAIIEKAISWSSRSWIPTKSQRENDNDLVKVEAFTRNKAIGVSETCERFPVLVRVTGAPWRHVSEMPAGGMDVVVAINVATKFVKNIMTMLVGRLSPNDRLSILCFPPCDFGRYMELTYMSNHGRHVARLRINKLVHINDNEKIDYYPSALSDAAQILKERGAEERGSRAGCIVDLWTHEENYICYGYGEPGHVEFPVHTIGVSWCTPRDMKHIKNKKSGTYVDCEWCDPREPKKGLALFFARIASVPLLSVRITLQAEEGIAISSIASGRYSNDVSWDEQSATVYLSSIFAGEQKTFIVYLAVPQDKEKLVTIGGMYQSKEQVGDVVVVVARPGRKCLPDKMVIHPKVAAELLRNRLMEGIAKQERGVLSRDTMRLLLNVIKNSDEGHTAPEDILSDLEEEVAEMTGQDGVNKESMLSSLNGHQLQRSQTKGTSRKIDAFRIIELHREDEVSNLVKIIGFTRSKAIMARESYNEFPVLVRVTVAPWCHPTEMPRGGLDIIAMLDISTNIQGERLECVKQAMLIVMDKLGPDDRFSIVSLQDNERCFMELTYMSDDQDHGRDAARLKITQLKASSGRCMGHIASTAIEEGAQILRDRGAEESRHRPACMMLLSDGEYQEILQMKISPEFPVHTFGIGADHNPKVMKYIADMTSGTYSFVDKDISNIKDALAMFITGLTSIAMSIKIILRAHNGIAISSIESGNYIHRVESDKMSGSIIIEKIYSGEQKDFIINLIVGRGTSKLMTISGGCKGVKWKRSLPEMDMLVVKPWWTHDNLAIHPDVAAELTRIRLQKGVLEMLETKKVTTQGLQKLWYMVKNSDEGRGAGEGVLSGLSMDVDKMSRDISGVPYMMSWLSCHKWQRATTKGSPNNSSAFRTIGQYADEDTNLVKVVTFTRSKALPSDDQCNKFPVLVRVMAAPQRQAGEMPHAGVDIVAVLDASAGMQGEKLVRMKMAMMVIIGKLRPEDRLSIVSFNTYENRLTRLTFMTNHGRDVARLKISNLVASGQGDFAAALREGAEILWWREAESSRRVGCIVFLSDSKNYEIFETAIRPEFPVHTFGLGTDHNPSMMKYIADITSGTYSFVKEDMGMTNDALALFITRLTSVAAMSIKITLRTNKGITISSIESGGYVNHVRNKQFGTIHIDNIYAGERKDFIVYLRVAEGKKDLMTIGGRYLSYDTVKHLAYTDVYVQRPHQEILPDDLAIQPELAAELVRIRLEKGISTKLEKGLSIAGLQQLWEETMETDEGRGAPAETLSALSMDVAEMKRDIENPSEYRKSGLPYTLSWLTSRKWQRATIKGTPFSSGAIQITGQDTDGRETPSQRDSICRLPFCCGFLYEVVCSYFQR